MRAHAGLRARHEVAAGHSGVRGFTLIEIVLVFAIAGVLASVAIPKIFDYRERIRVQQAMSDIAVLNLQIRKFMVDSNQAPPASLSEISEAATLDPWGRPYVYLNLRTMHGVGGARKNRNLVPINSDFDLYSKGKDGLSVAPLTAPASRDDVILANDAKFIGLASDYE